MGMVLGEGIGLEEKIGVIRRKQKRLREACERLISENQEIISDNFIFKATLEDESSNDRIILDRISAFIMDYHQNGNLDYCDSNMVKGLLKFLENNNWEEFIPKRTPTALA